MHELVSIVKNGRSWRALAYLDIRLKYRRTALGPFWMTATLAVLAITVGVIYGQFLVRRFQPTFLTSPWALSSGRSLSGRQLKQDQSISPQLI